MPLASFIHFLVSPSSMFDNSARPAGSSFSLTSGLVPLDARRGPCLALEGLKLEITRAWDRTALVRLSGRKAKIGRDGKMMELKMKSRTGESVLYQRSRYPAPLPHAQRRCHLSAAHPHSPHIGTQAAHCYSTNPKMTTTREIGVEPRARTWR